MKAKHTPGPWFTVREGFSAVYVEARIEGGMLQEVAMCGPTEAGPSQQEANAALIAAAPDLLETLQVLLSLHDACVDTADAWNASMEEARAAIAKATGDYHSDLRQRTSRRH